MLLWQKFTNLFVERYLTLGKGAKIRITNANNSTTDIDLTELAAVNSIGAADLAKIDGITNGTGAADKAVVLDSNGGATIPGELALDGNTMAVSAGVGITAGTGTVYKNSAIKTGGIIKTSILIDLTGLASSTTDLDIIGVAGGPAHLGQITAARNGTILGGRVTCLEVPAGGADDIDLYYATEGTGAFDDGVAALTEVALITKGSAWTLNQSIGIADFAASANKYLYLVGGEAGTAATYTAGKFLIELEGYDA
jgi:hypothetical protein